mmetsp:Transcript_119414/g.380845  ORF Transcript_119414/g.380845 Transcript_119414/m.380845 type:complete len:261 (-) Transcript_119414:966-1748(-)
MPIAVACCPWPSAMTASSTATTDPMWSSRRIRFAGPPSRSSSRSPKLRSSTSVGRQMASRCCTRRSGVSRTSRIRQAGPGQCRTTGQRATQTIWSAATTCHARSAPLPCASAPRARRRGGGGSVQRARAEARASRASGRQRAAARALVAVAAPATSRALRKPPSPARVARARKARARGRRKAKRKAQERWRRCRRNARRTSPMTAVATTTAAPPTAGTAHLRLPRRRAAMATPGHWAMGRPRRRQPARPRAQAEETATAP